jgi:hypothetical protein
MKDDFLAAVLCVAGLVFLYEIGIGILELVKLISRAMLG